MAKDEVRQGRILRGDLVVQALFILYGREPTAGEIALHAVFHRTAVAHVVVRGDDVAVRIQKTREFVIPSDMLGNAVNELDDGLRLALRRPDRAVQAAAAAGIEIKFFHKERSFRIGRIDFHL